MYKNWAAIDRITYTYFKLMLWFLDVESDFGRIIMEKHPEFFTEKEPQKVRLSELMKYAVKNYHKGRRGDPIPRAGVVTYGAHIAYNIPILQFAWAHIKTYAQATRRPQMEQGILVLPPELSVARSALQTSFGDILTRNGVRLIILENHSYDEIVSFAPAELIEVDPENFPKEAWNYREDLCD